jgi:hypothetical protein
MAQDSYLTLTTDTGTDTVLRGFPFPTVDEVDRMANIAGLGARMGLVALVTSFHARPVRSGRERVMFNVAMAIDAESLFFNMKRMGDFHNPDILRLDLFPPGDGGVAVETFIIHQIITGIKLAGENLPGLRMAIRAGNRCRMDARG